MKKKKQKTDWELLPEMYRELVPETSISHLKKGGLLIDAFAWDGSKMGVDFWSAINDEIYYIRSCS